MNIHLFEVLFQLDREIGVHLIPPIHPVLIPEVEEDHQRQDQEQDLWDLEGVEDHEGPDLVHDHQLELNRERRVVEFLMQLLLAELGCCLHLGEMFLHSLFEETVFEVDGGDDDRDHDEDEHLEEEGS